MSGYAGLTVKSTARNFRLEAIDGDRRRKVLSGSATAPNSQIVTHSDYKLNFVNLIRLA